MAAAAAPPTITVAPSRHVNGDNCAVSKKATDRLLRRFPLLSLPLPLPMPALLPLILPLPSSPPVHSSPSSASVPLFSAMTSMPLHPQPQQQQQQQSHPLAVAVLPPTVTCSFVGEGSANAVFRFTSAVDRRGVQLPSAEDPHSTRLLSTHLLRVPKTAPGVGSQTCIHHQLYYATVLQPLLGADLLVGQHLVSGVSAVRDTLNGLLAELNRRTLSSSAAAAATVATKTTTGHRRRTSHGERRADWIDSWVADVDVALLVENMAPVPVLGGQTAPAKSFTIEFKPKWLVQSPTAPRGARRCRTCAHSAFKTLSKHGKNKAGRKPKPCPMVLMGAAEQHQHQQHRGQDRDLDAALWDFIRQHLDIAKLPPSLTEADLVAVRTAVLRWMRSTDLFRRLASIQQDHDPLGALFVPNEDMNNSNSNGSNNNNINNSSYLTASSSMLDRLQTAMTLRDCTCYLRVSMSESQYPHAPVASVTAKLGDLDRKDGHRKLSQWQAMEKELLDGGFYLGTESPRQETRCWLEQQ